VVEGGVTAPLGFRAGAVACGIKRRGAGAEPPLDLAILAAEGPVPAAGVFTTNKAVAAPVVVSRAHLARSGGRAAAIVVNSGCANACTGAAGMAAARDMAAAGAAAVRCAPEHVLIASTGVIGVLLDAAKVRTGVSAAARTLDRPGADAAARAIMTTDPFPKSRAVANDVAEGTILVGGMAKGSGMIEPRMATMLAFLTTDAEVAPPLLASALRRAVDVTFNAITVDGECSTNDCVFALASGASGVAIGDSSYPALVDGLRTVSRALALGIVRGGEGATKLIAVTVRNARTGDDARRVARTIANSPLVKTAVHGADPNWGRIVAAAGRAGVVFDVQRATVRVGGVLLFENGLPHDDAAPMAVEHLKGSEVAIDVGLGTGGGAAATIWTCDLSAEYIRINGEYRT
jgi:glutamate N-acetyltransferase/amino-acid N-acetyltransferase